jgi:hypothetical protein
LEFFVFYPSVDKVTEQVTSRSPSNPFVLRTFPSLFGRVGSFFWLIVTTTAVFTIAVKLCGGDSSASCAPNVIRWAGLIPLGFFLSIVHFRFNNAYIFDSTDIYREEGRLSLCYKNPSIRYADIKGITVYQSFWGRVFNFGSIELGTAANEGNELIIQGIRGPHELAELIEALRLLNLDPDAWRNL